MRSDVTTGTSICTGAACNGLTVVGRQVAHSPETHATVVSVVDDEIFAGKADHIQHGAECVAEEGEASFTLQLHLITGPVTLIFMLAANHDDVRLVMMFLNYIKSD